VRIACRYSLEVGAAASLALGQGGVGIDVRHRREGHD
jgi:hypothetical protein